MIAEHDILAPDRIRLRELTILAADHIDRLTANRTWYNLEGGDELSESFHDRRELLTQTTQRVDEIVQTISPATLAPNHHVGGASLLTLAIIHRISSFLSPYAQ
jgi:hypothetical protein